MREYIHRWVPSNGSSETLLLLHGTGGDESDLLPLGKMLAPRAALLSPRGRVLENGMPRFFRRLAEGVFDEADVVRRAGELADFVTQASSLYGFDPAQVTAAGFSNGANIAAALLLLRPGLLARAVLLHPMVPLVPSNLPDLAETPVFIGAGQNDPLVSVPETERLAASLRQAGASVSVHWEAGGHSLTRAEATAARDWLGT